MAGYSKCSDDELADLIRQGDKAAYTEIYHRYKTLLYTFAYKRLGQREEARDVIHELFMTLWDKHQLLQIDTGLSQYLYTALRNRILDIVSHQSVVEKYIDHLQDYVNTAESPADHLVRQHNFEQLIEKEIASLPAKMRQVFELSRLSDFSRKQIAEELNISEETVKSHMHHALKLLKAKLGPLFTLLLIIY